MIIRNKSLKQNKKSATSNASKKTIIKKEDIIADELDQPIPIKTSNEEIEETPQLEEFEKIDISLIDFKERAERRRGDRRRGYRRIDERSLVSRAQQEAHSIKELSAREGYQIGLKRAQREIDEIKSSLSQFLSTKDEVYEKIFPHILEISLEIARKIIKKEVEISNEVLKNIIMNALDEINPDTQKVTIRVNPDDAEFAQASLPEIIEAKNISAKLSVSQDENIDAGSCILIANNGVIDASFQTQLAVLQNAFGIYKGGL